MKTYKNLYQDLCSFKNIKLAYKKARKGKSKKNYVLKFEKDLSKNLKHLQKELSNKTYKPKPLKEFILRDPKTRKICKSIFKDRIVHHAIINILEPIFDKRFIYDSFASRKGKGQHKAIKRFDEFKRKVSKNGKKLKAIKDENYVCGYCLKADIEKYFDTVSHKILINILRDKIKDNNLISLIEKILNNHFVKAKDKGMPLGNHTSQFFANVYLNELDYFVKHKIKAKYYIRYVDDFVILHNSDKQLKRWKKKIDIFLKKELKINLHKDKSKITPLHKGIQFLGFRIFYHHKLLRKSNIYNMKKKLRIWQENHKKGLISYEKLIEKLEGWFAHASHGNTYNLRKETAKQFNNTLYPQYLEIIKANMIQVHHINIFNNTMRRSLSAYLH